MQKAQGLLLEIIQPVQVSRQPFVDRQDEVAIRCSLIESIIHLFHSGHDIEISPQRPDGI